MATETIPLGAPDLGMTRAEILTYANEAAALFGSNSEMFFQLLFAYMVAMYLAGAQLTRGQYAIANITYLTVMTSQLFAGFTLFTSVRVWGDYSGLSSSAGSFEPYWAGTVIGIRAGLVVLSLWFGRRIRHPQTD